MPFAEKMNLIFLNSTHIIAAELNHPTKLCKAICPNLIQVKLLDSSATGLNHSVELY